jgi:hypothetical protein
MYDQSTGQVFKEWTVPRLAFGRGHDDRDWARKRPFPVRFVPRGAHGPRSLVDMATNVLADNIGDIDQEHMEAMPTRLLWRIWRFLEARWDKPPLKLTIILNNG